MARLGPRRVAAVAASAHPGWLAASLLPIVLRFLIWGHKWRRVLTRHGPVRFALAQQTLMAGVFANVTLPMAKVGGGIVRAVLVHRRLGWPLATCSGMALVDQATNALGSLLVFGALALPLAASREPASPRLLWLATGVLALGSVAAFVALRGLGWRVVTGRRARGIFARLTPRRFRAADEDGDGAWAASVFAPLLRDGSRTQLVADILWGAVSFLPLALAGALALRALDAQPALLPVMLSASLAYVTGNAIGVWGGIGITEAALATLWIQLGVAATVAAAAVLLHRTGFYLVALVWGGVAVALQGRRTAADREPLDAERPRG